MDDNQTTAIQDPETSGNENGQKTSVFDTGSIAGAQASQENGTPQPPVKKKSKTGLFIFILLLIVAIGVASYFVFFKKGTGGTGSSAEIQKMQDLTQEVQGLETQVKQNESDIYKNMAEYKEKSGGQSLNVNALNLNEEEKKLLQDRIAKEQDVSIKSLLQDILDKNKEIQDLKDKITEIEKQLPVPHIVKKGESHEKIAIDFLVNEKGLDKKKAKELADRALLMDKLIPGFKVYNFFNGEEYGTAVTQGTAPISPTSLVRREKKVLVDARDEAISQRDQLQLTVDDLQTLIKELETKRDEILNQIEILNKEKEGLVSKVGELSEEVNSLYYLADTEKNLKDKDILKGGFLKSTKLKDVSPEHFKSSTDLRTNPQITITASELGIDKIKSISIFPKFYNEGTDYRINIAVDKATATIIILTPEKFKGERLVISVN